MEKVKNWGIRTRARFIEVMEGLTKRCSGKPVKGRGSWTVMMFYSHWNGYTLRSLHNISFKMELIYYTQNWAEIQVRNCGFDLCIFMQTVLFLRSYWQWQWSEAPLNMSPCSNELRTAHKEFRVTAPRGCEGRMQGGAGGATPCLGVRDCIESWESVYHMCA